jgi:hypothetical protein
MSGKKRSRTERRAGERDLRKLARARQELARLEPGGSPERPIPVTTSAVIEGRARSTPCPLCAGSLRVDQHDAETIDGRSLRVVAVTCLQCGIARRLWFRITPDLAS